MGGFTFNIEGPKGKADRELREKLMELNVKKMAMDKDIMDRAQRGNLIDEEQRIANDPNTTPGRRAVAQQTMMDYGGAVNVPGLGNIPAVTSADKIGEAKLNQFMSTAQQLDFANRQISDAQASGNQSLAQALTVARDDMYKSAKDNFKKLPIKEIGELTDYKSLVDLGATAIGSITSEDLYGPVRGRVNPAIASTYGYPDYTKMMQAFSGVNNQILKARSGGAVTDQEAERFRAEIGDPNSNDFPDRMKMFTAQRKREYLGKLQVLRDSGYDIPDTLLPDEIREKIGSPKKTGAKGEPSGTSSRQVIQTTIDENGRIVIPR
jgi:hypothetical protein